MPKILIIRFRRVGDAVLCTSLCSSLKKSIANSEVHYLVEENMEQLFEGHPDIDKLILFPKKKAHSVFAYLIWVRQLIKRESYDIIIDTRSTFKTMFFSLFSLSSRYRITQVKPYNRLVCNYRIDIFSKSKEYVEQKLSLLSPLEEDYKITYNPVFTLYVKEQDKLIFRSYMESKGVDFSKPIILCMIVRRIKEETWPLDRMKDVLDRLLDKYGDAQLIINYGGQVEKDQIMEVYGDNKDPRIFTNIEANNLCDLKSLIVNSDYLFGNEGGGRHIAQALGVPSLAIYPPGITMENWLPNLSDRYDGICTESLVRDLGIQVPLSLKERYDYVTADLVWNILDMKLSTYLLPKTKNRES